MSLRSGNNPLETLNQSLYASAVLNCFIAREKLIANRFTSNHKFWSDNHAWWTEKVAYHAKDVNMFDIHEIRIIVIGDLAGSRNRSEISERYTAMCKIALKNYLSSNVEKIGL